ncbi:MAG: GNAT family N-acetyltransferase, partial [Burkholderiales bacterium]
MSRELSDREREALFVHFLALEPEDRRLRFGTSIGDQTVRNYVAGIDFGRDAVFGVFDAELRLVGVAHLARTDEFAELGVSVLSGHRGQGVGEALLKRAHLQARNWGVETLLMHCLAENGAMRHLAAKQGMRLAAEGAEVAAAVEVPPASASSVVTQMFAENIGLFDYALKAQLLAARRAMGMGKDR